MAFTKLNDDLGFISKLSDEPNDSDGMSSAELKAEFDKSGKAIQNYINSVLLTALELNGAVNIGVDNIPGVSSASTVQEALGAIVDLIKNITVGGIPDNSIDSIKLANNAVTSAKLSGGAVTAPKLDAYAVTSSKLADGAVTEAKLGNGAVTETKLAGGAVTSAKLGANSVTRAKLAASAVGSEQIDDLAITESKYFPGSIGSSAIKDRAISKSKLSDEAISAFAPAYTFGNVDKKPGSPSSEPEGTIYWVLKA